MKIAFLRALERNTDPRSNTFTPLSFAYLSSYLEKYGNYSEFFIEEEIEKLTNLKPDIIGISAYSKNLHLANQKAHEIKKKIDIPVVLGGPHISALPDSLPKYFDLGVVGEGESTFLEIVNNLKNNSLSEKVLSDIDGIVYKSENKNIVNKSRQIISNIDDIPSPKIELLDYYMNKNFLYNIHTSRGCPYKCIFCVAGNITEKTRYHSPERVVQDIENILKRKKFNPEQAVIYITDDLFAINIRRIEKIVKLIKENNLQKYFGFTCHARADIFTRDMALLLKEMNMLYVFFGLESGSNNVLKSIKAQSSNVEKNQRALEICKEYNIGAGAYFMVGAPEETKEDLAKTYWFINNNKYHLNTMDITQMTPLPGTYLWEYFIKNNFMDYKKFDSKNWEELDYGYKNFESDKMFLNKHYSKDFLVDSFNKLRKFRMEVNFQRNSVLQENGFLGNKTIGQQEGQFFYEKEIFKHLKKLIPYSVKNILEINPHHKEFERYYPEYNTTHIFPNNLPKKDSKFDLILFDHSLEQIKDLKNYILDIKDLIEKNGYIIFISYNINYFQYIYDLIFEKFSYNTYGIRQIENLNYFTQKTLSNLIDKNYLKVIDSINYKMKSQKYENNDIKEIQTLLKNELNFELDNNYSSLILCQKIS